MNMKLSILVVISGMLIFSCNNHPKPSAVSSDDSFKKDSLVYPFTHKYSLNWQPGDEKNAVLVLDCLKKYEVGDVRGCVDYFADSVEFIADRFYFKGSRDSLLLIITAMRNASTSVSKNFDTWITTYYPNEDDTWVTLWYTEVMTDHKGKVDSIYYTDDALIRNGKIVEYDEKQRLFPLPESKKN
jgi:hypothetical protein